jgi:3-hydroxyisobutyrate dehydrogenase
MSSKPKIGMVGVGRMGANMAMRLRDVGYPVVVVYDVRPEAAAETAKEVGAEAAASLARVTDLSDVVITVVTDDAAMDRVFAESGDSLLTGSKGKLFVNCATITPSVHVEVERRALAPGAESLEACMASSIPQARDGTLYLMVGGKRETFEKVKPMLEAMSSSLRYVEGLAHRDGSRARRGSPTPARRGDRRTVRPDDRARHRRTRQVRRRRVDVPLAPR